MTGRRRAAAGLIASALLLSVGFAHGYLTRWERIFPDFYSSSCGLVQRLSNGNTLIAVSTEGRVLEVTPAGRVVWEYLNPHSTVVGSEERVATIFEMIRLPRSRVAALVSKRD